jgi:alanine racemase
LGYIRLNKNNYFHNLDEILKRVGKKEKIIAVLKDNAYGHGLKEVASLAKEWGIKCVAVKNFYEADIVKNLFEKILVLCELPSNETHDKSNFITTISFLDSLKAMPKGSKVALKIDSGMHRNGIAPHELYSAVKLIKQKELVFEMFFTHFRSADELSSELFWQIKNFEKQKEQLKEYCKEFGLDYPKVHSANSAAIFREDFSSEDFVRAGIATYGYVEFHRAFDKPNLKPVLSLVAQKMSQRVLKKSQRVGYGGVYEAMDEETVSTYDIGYGDGIFRFDGKGELKIAEGCNILGRVSMDSFSANCKKDEVVVFENARYFAKEFDTITYEITTKLSQALRRVIV